MMSTDNVTYNYCIQSLRYIHTILGYDTIIQELNFIQHISNNSSIKSDTVSNNINFESSDIPTLDIASELDKDKSYNNTKNIIIESKDKKYVRTELPNEQRCEIILPTGKRCTFKKSTNNNVCSRHSK
jgi:hypothetical protein